MHVAAHSRTVEFHGAASNLSWPRNSLDKDAGQLPHTGRYRAAWAGRAPPQGFNMPNRVLLTESVKAGDTLQIAVFGINGPISLAPPNTIWFREAKMEFIR